MRNVHHAIPDGPIYEQVRIELGLRLLLANAGLRVSLAEAMQTHRGSDIVMLVFLEAGRPQGANMRVLWHDLILPRAPVGKFALQQMPPVRPRGMADFGPLDSAFVVEGAQLFVGQGRVWRNCCLEITERRVLPFAPSGSSSSLNQPPRRITSPSTSRSRSSMQGWRRRRYQGINLGTVSVSSPDVLAECPVATAGDVFRWPGAAKVHSHVSMCSFTGVNGEATS